MASFAAPRATAGGAFSLAALREAAQAPSSNDSVEQDKVLLHGLVRAINDAVGTGEDRGLPHALDAMLPDQHDLNALALFVFDCRFGWSERGQGTGGGGAGGNLDLSVGSSVGGKGGNAFDVATASSSHAGKRALNTVADRMITLLRDCPPSERLLRATEHCIVTTKKPVVRKQVFIHLFDWFKAWSVHHNQTSPRPEGAPPCAFPDSVYTRIRSLFVRSVTDIWSAIRKNTAVRLYSVVDMLPMGHVEALFQGLVTICVAPEKGPESVSWQAKEGALLGVTAIVKKFRRSLAPAAEKSAVKHPKGPSPVLGERTSTQDSTASTEGDANDSPTSSWLKQTDDAGMPESFFPDTTAPAAPAPKSPPSRKNPGLRLSLSSLGESSAAHDAPPSPSGAAQNFSMVTPTANRALAGGARAFAFPPVDDDVALAGPPLGGGAGGDVPPASDGGDSPSSRATLTFGKEYVCVGGLPDFIEREMRRVTYANLGHPQLTVRENATKAFAAFLSRSPSKQTLNAFSDVIAKLAAVPIAPHSVDGGLVPGKPAARDGLGVPDPYLAEGLLSLCVILAKLRMVPEYYLNRHWRRIFGTLNKYLGHTASTVRQMSSTVFKHLAFKGSRAWGNEHAQDSPSLLMMVLEGLVLSWDASTGQPLTWQSREGRLLTYDLVIDFLLTNHSNYLATDPSRKLVRRASSPPKFEMDPSGGMATLLPNPVVKSPPLPPVTPKRGAGGHRGSHPSPATSIPSPSPSPSADPWVTPAPRYSGGAAPATVLETSLTSSLGGGRKRPEPRSLLMVLVGAGAAEGAVSSPQQGQGTPHLSQLKDYLQRMIIQTKGCLADDRFELRRMADQVLPGLVKLLCWIDASMLGGHWDGLEKAMVQKDALTCRFVATSLLVMLKYTLGLRNSLMARHRRGGSSSRPNSRPASPKTLRSPAATDSEPGALATLPRPTGSNEPGSLSLSSPGTTTISEAPFGVVFKTKATLAFSVQTRVFQSLLKSILPNLHQLAKRAVTENLFSATMEVMVLIHSLFIVDGGQRMLASPQVPEEFVGLDLRVPVAKAERDAHVSIIVDRIVRVHTVAHPKHPQRQRSAASRSVQMAAREKRAQALDRSVSDAICAHIPKFFAHLSHPNPSDLLKLVPVALRWVTSRETVELKCAMLHAVVHGLHAAGQRVVPAKIAAATSEDTFDDDDDFDDDEREEETQPPSVAVSEVGELFAQCTGALEHLLASSAEAPVLRACLEVVLALAAILPRTSSKPDKSGAQSGPMLSRLLPVVAERLRQAAPRSLRLGQRSQSMVFREERSVQMQWLSNDIDHMNQDDSRHLDSTDDSDNDERDGGDGSTDEPSKKPSNSMLTLSKLSLRDVAVSDKEAGTQDESMAEVLEGLSTSLRERSTSSVGGSSFDDDRSGSDNDDWDDWDDEGGAETGNDALSIELGWFVSQLHRNLGGKPVRVSFADDIHAAVGNEIETVHSGVETLNFLASRDLEVLCWALHVHSE